MNQLVTILANNARATEQVNTILAKVVNASEPQKALKESASELIKILEYQKAVQAKETEILTAMLNK